MRSPLNVCLKCLAALCVCTLLSADSELTLPIVHRSPRAGRSLRRAADAGRVSGTVNISFDRFYIDRNYGGNGKPGWVRAGDMDNDGDVDIVAGGGYALFVYENDGRARGWTRHGNFDGTGQIGCNGAALLDVDGDKDLDVIAAKYRSDLGWWENPGGILRTQSWTFHKLGGGVDGWFAHDILCVDLDQDGKAKEVIFDLQSGYWDAPVKLFWYKPGSDPKASWERYVIADNKPCPNNNHAGLDVADIDRDGHADLVFSNGWFEAPEDPTGTSWVWHKVTDIYGISNSLARDVDGDGDLDLILAAGHHGEGLYWFAHPEDLESGQWTQHTIDATVHHPEGLQALDVDGDRDVDLIAAELFFGEDAGEPGWNEEAHNVYVYLNLGGAVPSWEKANIAPDSYASHQLQTADVNRDGKLDIISEGCGYKIVSYYENTSTGGGKRTTWYVDASVVASGDGRTPQSAFKAIQKGIDAAQKGDIVLVARGTYVENINFEGRNILLRSHDSQDHDCIADTIIDGNQAGAVVTFGGTEDETCVLYGFTIHNGKAGRGGGLLGGTEEAHTRATIRNNVIASNEGGGVAYCAGIIAGNTVLGNHAELGGGISHCEGIVQNNIITGNSASSGGGLFRIRGTIRNNLIANNSAEWGGGLYDCDGSSQNNTIIQNHADVFGGGLAYCDGDIRNCIIWGNISDSGAQLREGSAPTYCCVQDWTEGGEGNTSENPRFVSLDGGDYRLSGDSPCIDQGQNTEWMWQAVDLDGKLRVWRGKDSMTVDMGAYEYGSFPFGVTRIVDTPGGDTELTWISRLGDTYTIWSCGDLSGPQWSEEQTIASEGESTTWADSNTAPTRKFYRIEFELRGAPPTDALDWSLVPLCLTPLDNDSIFNPLESAAP